MRTAFLQTNLATAQGAMSSLKTKAGFNKSDANHQDHLPNSPDRFEEAAARCVQL